jgi:hypothetical protein
MLPKPTLAREPRTPDTDSFFPNQISTPASRGQEAAEAVLTTLENPMVKRALLLGTFLLLASTAALSAQATPRSGGARSGGARAAGAAPAANSILGKWEFTVESPQGANVMTVTFQRIDGTLMGSGQSQMGSFDLAEVTQTGADFSFKLRFAQNGQTMDIPFTGKVTGENAEGNLTFAMGGQAQSMPFKAKKVP